MSAPQSRIVVINGKRYEPLHTYFSPSALIPDYGGTQGFDMEAWSDRMIQEVSKG